MTTFNISMHNVLKRSDTLQRYLPAYVDVVENGQNHLQMPAVCIFFCIAFHFLRTNQQSMHKRGQQILEPVISSLSDAKTGNTYRGASSPTKRGIHNAPLDPVLPVPLVPETKSSFEKQTSTKKLAEKPAHTASNQGSTSKKELY